jgi:hypothetical protein
VVRCWFSFPFDVVEGSPGFVRGSHFVNKGWTDFFAVQNGGGYLELGFEDPRLYSTTRTWLADTWYHTALTYDAGMYHLYVNGVLEESLYRPDPLLGDVEDIHFSHSLATPWNPAMWWEQRLDVIAAGYPRSQQVSCDPSAPVDGVEETVTPGSTALTYDPVTDQYTYVWKTDRSWAASCRQLVVRLADSSYHRANFRFS